MRIRIKYAIVIPQILKKCFLSIYVFILIFSPPLIPYPHLFLGVATSIVLLMRRIESSLQIAALSGLLQWLASMTILAVYLITVPLPVSAVLGDIVNLRHYISLFNRYAVLVVVITPCSIFLIHAVKKYSYEYFLEIMIYAGLIEGVCSIVAYLFPPVKQLFLSLMSRYSNAYDNTWYSTVRSFGFAGTMVDLFGLGIALIAGVCFYYGTTFKNKRRHLFFSFMIAVSALLNARTGVLLFAVGIALATYDTICSRRADNIFILALLFAAAPGIAVFILRHVSIQKASANWIQQGLGSVIDFLVTRDTDTLLHDEEMAKLFSSRYWNFPRFPRLLIGTGHTLYEAKGYRHSDVGYVNELWLGGIFAYIFLYKDILLMGFRLFWQKNNRIMRFSGAYCVICFFIFQIKGAALGYNPGAVSLFLLLFVSTYYARRPKYDKSQLYYTRL